MAKTEAAKRELWLVRCVGDQPGVYDDLRRFPVGADHPRAGEPFWIDSKHFSDCEKEVGDGRNGWMERIDPDTLKPIRKNQEKPHEPAKPIMGGVKLIVNRKKPAGRAITPDMVPPKPEE